MSNGPFYERGLYRGRIVDQGLTKASTGTVQIALKIQVMECLQPQHELEQQYERSIFMPITEKTMEYLVPKLEALGYTRDSIKYLNLNESNCHDLRGTEADFFCKHESGQDGQLREKWDVATGGGSKPLDLKPPDARELRNLDMLFGRARKAAAVPVSAPRQRTQTTAAATATAPDFPDTGVSDDDIPY